MKQRPWAVKPGQATPDFLKDTMHEDPELTNQFCQLIEEHAALTHSSNTVVLNHHKEVVFFIDIDLETESSVTEVYVWKNGGYQLLDSDLALPIANSYFDYLDAVSEAHRLLGGSSL